jgi:large subunit ribosomal protein L21
MFAVIQTGGKQYRVVADDVLRVEKVKGEPGEIVTFPVLVLGGESVRIGKPTVEGASVAAEVVAQARGDKVIVFKKRRRKNSRRTIGHRQEFTLVRVTEILTDGAKPSKTARPRPAPRPKPARTEAEAAAPAAEAAAAAPAPKAARKAAKSRAKVPAKKPAARKPGTKKKK